MLGWPVHFKWAEAWDLANTTQTAYQCTKYLAFQINIKRLGMPDVLFVGGGWFFWVSVKHTQSDIKLVPRWLRKNYCCVIYFIHLMNFDANALFVKGKKISNAGNYATWGLATNQRSLLLNIRSSCRSHYLNVACILFKRHNLCQ